LLVAIRQYDKIEKNEMGWACREYGEGSSVYRVLVGKPRGKKPLGKPRLRWEDNIKIVGCVDCFEPSQDRDRCRALVNAVMNFGFYNMRGIT
jgi:hypothetical protein